MELDWKNNGEEPSSPKYGIFILLTKVLKEYRNRAKIREKKYKVYKNRKTS